MLRQLDILTYYGPALGNLPPALRRYRDAGPGVSDAWFAALAMEHRCIWITCDRDFARFPGLRWSTPA